MFASREGVKADAKPLGVASAISVPGPRLRTSSTDAPWSLPRMLASTVGPSSMTRTAPMSRGSTAVTDSTGAPSTSTMFERSWTAANGSGTTTSNDTRGNAEVSIGPTANGPTDAPSRSGLRRVVTAVGSATSSGSVVDVVVAAEVEGATVVDGPVVAAATVVCGGGDDGDRFGGADVGGAESSVVAGINVMPDALSGLRSLSTGSAAEANSSSAAASPTAQRMRVSRRIGLPGELSSWSDEIVTENLHRGRRLAATVFGPVGSRRPRGLPSRPRCRRSRVVADQRSV